MLHAAPRAFLSACTMWAWGFRKTVHLIFMSPKWRIIIRHLLGGHAFAYWYLVIYSQIKVDGNLKESGIWEGSGNSLVILHRGTWEPYQHRNSNLRYRFPFERDHWLPDLSVRCMATSCPFYVLCIFFSPSIKSDCQVGSEKTVGLLASASRWHSCTMSKRQCSVHSFFSCLQCSGENILVVA